MADADGRSLGEVLRGRRVELDITLRDLAKQLGIAPSYLSDIENDRRVPSQEVLERLAAELKLKLDELMARAGRFGDVAERYMKQHPAAGVEAITRKRGPTISRHAGATRRNGAWSLGSSDGTIAAGASDWPRFLAILSTSGLALPCSVGSGVLKR